MHRLFQRWLEHPQYQHPRPSSATARLERVYCGAQALYWLSLALPTALTVLLAQARGLSLAHVGGVMALYAIVVALCEVPSGLLADALGRKRVALLAYGVQAAALLALLFAFSLPAFLAWAVLSGAGRALASGALEAWFVDALQATDPDADLQPPLARAATAELLALTVGTLAGSLLPDLLGHLPEDGSAVLSPLSSALVAALAVKAVLVAFVARAVRDVRRPAHKRPALSAQLRAIRQRLGHASDLRALLLAALLGGVALAGLETFWQPRFALWWAGGATAAFGLLMAGSFLLGVVGNLASIPLSRALGRRHGVLAGAATLLRAVSLLLLALQTSPIPAAAFFWLVYLQAGVAGSPVKVLLNGRIGATERASLLSVHSLASYLGFALGSLVLGVVAEHGGIPAAWLVAGAALLPCAVIYGGLERGRVGRGAAGGAGLDQHRG
jgi:predicted MFS family arabinose efflux permease